MSRYLSNYVLAGLICLFSIPAFGSVSEWKAGWTDRSALNGNSAWSWDNETAVWDIDEEYEETAPVTFWCSGTNNPSPLSIHIVKDVVNNSSYEWTSFELEITGVGVSLGNFSYDVFGSHTLVGDKLTLHSPDTVDIGESFTLEFDVIVPSGQFNVDFSQTPIPEPATLVLLGLGSLVFARKRK